MPGKICQAAAADRELPYHGSDRSISGNPLCCDWNCTPIENTGASGERYRDAQFIRENNILTIGVEDENPVFDTERYPDGMGYILRERVESVTFGVAWADDYTDGDVRTWLAADPWNPLPKNIQLTLTPDEALIFADWMEHSEKNLPKDSAERYVLWNMICQLEKTMEPDTYENYSQKLEKAKENVKKNY